jgi:peptidase M23-like protein/putative peptidoglycan binding protein
VVTDFTSHGISLQDVAQKISSWTGEVHMATLAWVANEQGWKALDRCVAALEIFPDENEPSKHPGDCIWHAHQEGLTKVTLMFKTKAPNTPQTYDLSICHSLYTADDIQPTPEAWAKWESGPCQAPVPPQPPAPVPLTPKQIPYTGPYYGPSNPKGPMKGPTAKALKRFAIRLDLLEADLSHLDEHYGKLLEDAMRKFQREQGIQRSGQYGDKTWQAVRAARVRKGPHKGEYALDKLGQKLIKDEWLAAQITMCYPMPLGSFAPICQGHHRTSGDNTFAPNWAIDFCAPPGTPILAVENATIQRLTGNDPNDDDQDPSGAFGWSIHYKTPAGYWYYWTHFGRRAPLSEGQKVSVGQTIGWVGDQEFRPDHIHGGVTSPNGQADAKARITAVSQAPRIPEL